ncbi:MAG: ferric reductase-like transmembrane domain-containing protein, partial [Micromonosporaceae bacterium]|nr:ferric reductase-like transmembrane domain-containing protein [Micromonosporaceae bacterium]
MAETDGRGYRADGYRADGYQVDGYRDDGYWGPAQPEPEPAPQRRGHVALLDGEAGRQRMARMPVAARQPMAGNRLFLLILFWVMLAVSVELWWADAPGRSIGGVAGLLIGVGRITGMAGGFTLLVQILLMSRVAWLEQWIGAHDLLIWHRWLGTSLMVLIPAHAVFLIFGYAAEGQTSAAGETILMLRTYPAMISAFVATGLLVSIGILAIRAIRRHLPYEVWYYLHLTSYLVLLWGYGHQFAAGADLVQGGFARRYWFGLYMLVIVSLAWGRVVEPLWLNLRHRFR